jgi:hypothetical protein
MFYVTLLYQDVNGWSALRSRLFWLFLNTQFLLATQLTGRIDRRHPPAQVVAAGCVTATIGMFVVSRVGDGSPFDSTSSRANAASTRACMVTVDRLPPRGRVFGCGFRARSGRHSRHELTLSYTETMSHSMEAVSADPNPDEMRPEPEQLRHPLNGSCHLQRNGPGFGVRHPLVQVAEDKGGSLNAHQVCHL